MMTSTPGASQDIGPDEGMDLEGGTVLAPTEGGTALAVPFTAEQLAHLERIASERGITPLEVVQRLVEEGFETRARRSAA
jgi:hypothetical protein